MTQTTPENRTEPVLALCCRCGNQRTASPNYLRSYTARTLRCTVCKRGTDHVPVRLPGVEDWREQGNAKRPLTRYDPVADLRKRYPGWHFTRLRLANGGISVAPGAKFIVLDGHRDDDPETMRRDLAYCIAHMDLGHVVGNHDFTEEECQAADELSQQRLAELWPTPVEEYDRRWFPEYRPVTLNEIA